MRTSAGQKPQPAMAALGPVPRDVILTRDGKALAITAAIIAIAALGLGAWLSILHVRQSADRERRIREGTAATADVLSVTTTRGDHPRQVVTYRFVAADGTVHVGTERLGQRDRLERLAGGTIAVGYLRSDPERSWVSGHEPDIVPVWVAPMVTVALAAFSWLLVWRVRREWRLLSEGRAAEGRVVTTKRVATQHHRATRINYEFRTLAGGTVQGHAELNRRPPAAGSGSRSSIIATTRRGMRSTRSRW